MINKNILATAVLATVAIAMTMTALSLASPQSQWDDGVLLRDAGLDSSAVAAVTTAITTATIPNTPDAQSVFDTASEFVSSEWLIPPAFATLTYDDIDDQIVTEGDTVTISVTATTTNSSATLTYNWKFQSPGSPDLGLDRFGSVSSITFVAPDVSEDTGPIRIFVDVGDGDELHSTNMLLTILDSGTVTNTAPTVEAGGPLSVALGSSVSPSPTVTDPDGSTDHTYTWTSSDPNAVTFSNATSLSPTITPTATATVTTITLTLTVVDGEHTEHNTIELRIFDPNTNVAPTVNVGDDIPNVNERTSVTLTGTVDDPNNDPLTYLWSHNLGADTVVTGENTESLRFTAPGISSATQLFDFTLTVTDPGGLFASDTVTVTVQDVPIKVSYVTYNPGSGQLKIIFNQDIESGPSYGSIYVRSADSGSGGISFSAMTEPSSSGRIITATLSTEQQATYADLQNPQLVIDSGAVTAPDGTSITATSDIIRAISNKKSSSSSIAPIVDLNTLAQARIVDIPPAISEQVSSHDDSDPLEPILHNDTFDFPLAINEHCYLLDDTTNTLTPQIVTAGQTTEIAFIVYTNKDLAHFTLYLNLQDDNTNYADSDTYITYTNGGTVDVTDPHGYIADATITVTQDDDSMPEKKTVSITIYFDEPMGSTNMVAYMWNTDRKATFVNLIDAVEVVAAAVSEGNNSDNNNNNNASTTDSESAADTSERTATGHGSNTQSDTGSFVVIAGADDDAQTLLMIRMWSGYESESITDAELFESLNLDYPQVDIPTWMMTELGVLVSNGDVTVKEFKTALVYMLERLTA